MAKKQYAVMINGVGIDTRYPLNIGQLVEIRTSTKHTIKMAHISELHWQYVNKNDYTPVSNLEATWLKVVNFFKGKSKL